MHISRHFQLGEYERIRTAYTEADWLISGSESQNNCP